MNNTISRTGERVLGVIGIVFNVLTIILLALMMTSLSGFEGTEQHQQLEQEILNDPMFQTADEAQMALETFNAFLGGFGVFGWILVAFLIISTIFAVLALVKLKGNRNVRMAGGFFIVAGLFAGILSLTSILFYIAAIMCFVRKPPMRDDDLLRKDDNTYADENTPYRPL